MTKKIYLSEVTNDNSQLEFSVTTKGIHFDIQQEDGTYLASLTFTKNDVESMIEELNMLTQLLEN